MRKVLLWLLAVVPMWGQSPLEVTGTWQGTVQSPSVQRRIVLKIVKDDQGELKTTLYAIDQAGQSFGASSTVLKGDVLTVEIAGNGASYTGRVAADGRSATGSWTQGGPALPLNLVKVNPDAAWEIPKPPELVKAMAKDADPSFEVATVKPGNPDRKGHGFRIAGRRFATVNTTLADILQVTYSVQAKQLVGLPAWASEERWEIEGEPDAEGQPSLDQWRVMLKKLLAERFQLKFHVAQREMPVYILTVSRDGLRAAKTSAAADDPVAGLNLRGPGRLVVRNATMANVADLFQSSLLDRPVLDRTGLGAQRYDFQMNWQWDATQYEGRWANVPLIDPPLPDLYTAMPEQVGIRIEAVKASANVMEFERLERPGVN